MLIFVLLTGIVTQACGDDTGESTSSVGDAPASSVPQTTPATVTTTTTQPPTTTTTQPPTTTTTQPPTTTTTQPPTTTTTQPPTTTTTQPPPDGSAIYSEYCAVCHGNDLEGGVGPALGAEGHAAQHHDEELTSIVTSGKAAMPGFGDILSPDEISLVIAYLREMQGPMHEG